MEKKYVHKNVNLLFYILFTVVGIYGSIIFVDYFEAGYVNYFLLGLPTALVTLIPYLIFFLGLIIAIYFYWDIVYPNEKIVKGIYLIFFIIWIVLVLLFGFVFPSFAFDDYSILITNLFIISPMIIIMMIISKDYE